MRIRTNYFIIIIPLVSLIVVSLFFPSSQANRFIYDHLISYYPSDINPSDAAFISIDKASLKKLSGWPLNRATHSRAIYHLRKAGVAVIVYNLAFTTKDNSQYSGDNIFLKAIAESHGTVLPIIAEDHKEIYPFQRDAIPGAMFGHVDLSPENDGVLRKAYLYAGIAFPRWSSLALSALYLYSPDKSHTVRGLRTPYLNMGFSNRWSRDYEILIPPGIEQYVNTLPTFSFIDLLEGKIDKNKLENRVIFIGMASPDLEPKIKISDQQGSFFSTQIHAFLFSSLNQGYSLITLSYEIASALGGIITFFWIVASLVLSGWAKLLFRGAGLTAMLFLLVLPYFGYWANPIPALTGCITLGLITLIFKLLSKFKLSN